MNENHSENSNEQADSFQKLWSDFIAKSMQAGLAFASHPPPPELLREVRSDFFRSLSESWEKFMRTPQFLDAMKQMMEQAIAARKMTNEFLAKTRNDLQAPSREDVDSIMLSVRHMEKRLLDRLEELSNQVSQLNQRVPAAAPAAAEPDAAKPKRQAPSPSKRPGRNIRKAQRL